MNIKVARHCGFCFGVKRAIDMALEAADQHQPVFVLGELVHNEQVVESLKKKGIRTLKRMSSVGRGKTLIIRAHGAGSATLLRAKKSGYQIIDATCPMVKEIHSIARKMEQQGYRILVIGDRNHDEVKGIIGQLKTRAIVIDPQQAGIWQPRQPIGKAAVVIQSTQDMQVAEMICKHIQNMIPVTKCFNTICRPTRQKQNEIRELPAKVDVMIIIGSHTSANTKRLFEIARSINPLTHWIETENDLLRKWFKNKRSVGVAAGASTPRETIGKVVKWLKKNTHD